MQLRAVRGLARVLTLLLTVAALAPIPVSGAPADSPTTAPFTPRALPCETFPCYTLTFEPSGGGSGSMKTTDSNGVPDGLIDCRIVFGVVSSGSTCSHRYVDTQLAGSVNVDYTITPDLGSRQCVFFLAICGDSPATRSQTISKDTVVPWEFRLNGYVVSVSKTGAGTGTVSSSPPGINCGAICQAFFTFGSNVALVATPDAGASFAGWTGACAGQDASCDLSIPASNVSTNAVFAFGSPTPTPTPTPTSGLTLTTSAPTPPGAKDPVILWGEGFTLTVGLGSAQANRTIRLEGTRDGQSWTPIQTLTTDSTGRASLFYRPVTNLYYRAIGPAAGSLPEMTSNQVRTTVRELAVMRPTNGARTRTIARGTPVTFSTTVRPSRPELAAAKVSFFFSRQVTANQLETIRRDVLVDAAGVARTTFDFPISGDWFVRSQANPTPYNANSLMTTLERYRVD